MSGIIHSLRNLFGSPAPANNRRGATTRSRARQQSQVEEEGINGEDDDVFSTFDPETQEDEDQEQMEEEEEEVVNTQPPEEGKDKEGEDNSEDDADDNAETQQQQQQQSESTAVTGEQSLATQMSSAAEGGSVENGIAAMEQDDDQEEEGTSASPANAAASAPAAAAAPTENEGDANSTTGAPQNEQSASNPQQTQPNTASLTNFFSHIATVNNRKGLAQQHQALHSNNTSISYKEWKNARKGMLQQFLTCRLIGPDDDEDDDSADGGFEEGDEHNNEGENESMDDDDEECSFTSEVLDEPFGLKYETMEDVAMTDAQASNANRENESDDEEEEDAQLQTQPQLGTDNLKDGDDNQDEDIEEEEETPLQTQQDEPEDITPTRRLFRGIKRKLGFATGDNNDDGGSQPDETAEGDAKMPAKSAEDDKDDEDDDNEERKMPAKKKPRTKRRTNTKQPRHGLMWDGQYKSIPQILDCSTPCTNVEELDLSSERLDLSVCRVLRTWELRSTKRMDKLERGGGNGDRGDDAMAADVENSETLHPSQVTAPFHSCEDDGPLNSIYKRVFSMEIVQLLDDVPQNQSTLSPSVANTVANMTTAAFHDGKQQLERTTARKKRRAVRKIRVFFYNRWADAVEVALSDFKKQSKEKKKKVVHPFLLSLANVPAECILPRAIAPQGSSTYMQQYVNNPLGDDEFGVSSPYCICIGDKSSMRFGEQKVYFDSDELELRLVEAPPANSPMLAGIGGEETDFVLDDAVFNTTTINTSERYYREGERSEMIKRYVELRKRKESMSERIIFNPDEDKEEEDERSNAEAPGPGLAGLRGSTAAGGNGQNNGGIRTARSGEANATTGEATAESARLDGDRVVRPRSIVPLANLQPLLLSHNTERLKDPITVYGIVLGFSPPSLTRTEEWVMSIVLIDDTLPLSNQSTQGQASVDNAGESSEDPKEMHVPSVTLVLFSKDKSKLPVVRYAGDVICCERVFLQKYSGAPQLCARRYSKIVIIRPEQSRRPGDNLLNSVSVNDWSTLCSCHSTNDNRHRSVNLTLANSLWRWGQRRLSAHPTMSPNCYLSIAGVGDHNEVSEVSTSGDLTAAVTGIMAVPEHLRRRDTPRGYIRLWDGTGPSRSDPPPFNADVAGVTNPSDPPEQVLIEIDKMIRSIPPSTTEPAIQAPITLCGRVLNAVIWEENLWNLIHREKMISIGSFIRLRNINNAKLPNGSTNCLSVHAKSSLTPLPFDTYEVKGLLKGHDSRMKQGAPPNPTSAILPARSNNKSNRTDAAVQEMRNHGISMIEECLQQQPPASFTAQFEVAHTIPACNPTSSDALKVLCTKKRDGSLSFRFALHVKDASSEMDVLCLGQVASEVLGIAAQDIIDKPDSCQQACATLKELMSLGSICEGKIRSIVGKDGKVYFVLQSIFCITAAESV